MTKLETICQRISQLRDLLEKFNWRSMGVSFRFFGGVNYVVHFID